MPALSAASPAAALSLIDKYRDEPLYWYLISKGYRTYRFLPVFFREFYPRHDVATPPVEAAVLYALGRRKFGDSYDGANGACPWS